MTSVCEAKLLKKVREHLYSTQDFNINKTDDIGTSLLHFACEHGMLQLCSFLVENKANVDVTDSLGRTPLMIAAHYGFHNIIDFLINHEANLNIVDVYGFNAAMHSVYSGDFRIYQRLSPKHVPKETTTTYLGAMSSLCLASSLGKKELVLHIIAENNNLVDEEVSKSGMTPLMLAVCGGHSDIVGTLIKARANLQTTSKAQLSPISYAQKLSFPLLKLNIPTIQIHDNDNVLGKRKPHPLTPNLYISPIKKVASPKRAIDWLKISMKSKRSKSLELRKTEKNADEEEKGEENILKSIFVLAKMEQYLPLFEGQEINFKTFLTMNEEDLSSIGVTKSAARMKMLNLIDHYRKIFNCN